MKRFAIVPMIAVLALGATACSKAADTSNATTAETNTIVEESDANFAATDGVATDNSADLLNDADTSNAANAF